MLTSVSLDELSEVSLLVEQSYPDQGHPQITGGLQLVSGDVAQSARIDRKRFAEPELHAEVGDAVQRRVAMGLLKPCLTLQVCRCLFRCPRTRSPNSASLASAFSFVREAVCRTTQGLWVNAHNSGSILLHSGSVACFQQLRRSRASSTNAL